VLLALTVFWGGALLLLGGGALALQLLARPQAELAQPDQHPPAQAALAPPTPAPAAHGPAVPAPAAPAKPAGDPTAPDAHTAAPAAAAQPRPPPASAPARPPPPGAAIAPPDPALLEPSRLYEGASLPRIGPDRRTPMRAYAAGYDPAEKRPRIALLLADFGMNEQDSDEAVRTLPAAVSLAVSPYAQRTAERLLGAARARGHEMLAALPLEPQNVPLDTAGPFSLLTGNPPATNAQRLEWALSRFTGYVGATGALGRLHGERYAAAPELYAALLDEVARRGLLYIDPRPGAVAPKRPGMPPFRAIDVVIDVPPFRTDIDARLARLEQVARERGTALGLATGPLPTTTERIAIWATALPARGFALVPVSSLAAPPLDKP
jgi:polysaccharide deacetylase 2 family uncharacterized protein YibQ